MRSTDRIRTLWNPPAVERASGNRRQRLIAGAGLVVLVAGLLTAVGLGAFVIFALAVVLAGGIGIAAALAVLGHRDGLRTVGRSLGGTGTRGRARIAEWARRTAPRMRLFGVFVLRQSRVGLRHGAAALAGGKRLGVAAAGEGKRLGAAGVSAARERAPGLVAAGSEVANRAARQVAEASRSATVETKRLAEHLHRESVPHETQEPERRRQALDLNAAGTRLRRDGYYDEAAELHEGALEILRDLQDRHSLALTLNNLALALSQTGRVDQAVDLFEESASILHDLGDEELEGRVMANLGLTHRRNGRREESDNVLELALTKLPPTSSAYRKVEGQLRRAS
ncbi:MAG TPA: tetratricopeptide repeat protein [Gaiellaceae bacterium]